MRFQRRTVVNLAQHQYNRVFFHFYLSFIYIALIHLSEILIWSIFLLALDLSGSAIEAILFSGSCYTTVGFEPDILPNGWKTIAFFISLTGLFSLAWTTTIMIAMTTTYKAAWDQKYGNPDQGL
ncbi:hypothetical protein [Polynucleobacter meluiroseus]|nr:hypothetical protein [Polynucleobacter meluiroseus]